MNHFEFGSKSRERLGTCHSDLIDLAERSLVISPIDVTIVWGWRPEEIQTALFDSGASKKPWPESKHNHLKDVGVQPIGEVRQRVPWSLALDFAPWIDGAIPWGDTHAFAVVAGVFFAVANAQNIRLRWGGDWDMDGSTEDQTFMDWGHLELVL